MHVHNLSNFHESPSCNSKGDLEAILEAYHRCTQYQRSLETSLMQILDQREREAEVNLNAARKELEYVRNMRRGIGVDHSNTPEPRAASPDRMEATTWRWFQSNLDHDGLSSPSRHHSVLTETPLRRSDRQLCSTTPSRETMREVPFDYLAMKNEPTDDCAKFTNIRHSSDRGDDLDSSVDLTASLGSLANSLRSHVEQPFVPPAPFTVGKESPPPPLVTVDRESLATLLNAFDYILNNGAI